MLIIRTNTTCRYSTIVYYYSPQHVSAFQICHHQVGVGCTRINRRGQTTLFAVAGNITVLYGKLYKRYNYVTELLRYKLYGTVKNEIHNKVKCDKRIHRDKKCIAVLFL